MSDGSRRSGKNHFQSLTQADVPGSQDGCPGGQSAFETHLTQRPFVGLQSGVPGWQSPSTKHSTQVPLATLQRRPPQSASIVHATQMPRV